MLAAAADPSGTDIISTLAHASPAWLLALAVVVLVTPPFGPYARLKELQKQLDAKDAALERKDSQIQALQAGLVDKAIPAIVESTAALREVTPVLQRFLPLIQTTVNVPDPRRSE